jgi:hypothetical protein
MSIRNIPSVISLVTLLTFAGCAQVWVKPGASQSDLDADSYACLQRTQQQQPRDVVNPGGAAPQIFYNANGFMYDKCMNEKGWVLQNAHTSAQQNTGLDK